MAKQKKLETYGEKKMPLVRGAHMTDAQWAKAKAELDATYQRMGKETPWNPYCKGCGKRGVRIGVLTGLCMDVPNNCYDKLEF